MSSTDRTQVEWIDGGGAQALEEETVVQDSGAVEASRELSRRLVQPPADIPGFSIHGCLGEGAFGSVWLARENNTGKQVAIKFYTHRRGLDWALLNREVEKLAVLYTSRNIVRLLEVGGDGDPPYYIMEYIENGSLAGFLNEGPIPPHEAVRIAKGVLHALVHAHGSGILHCDLKPANVLLDGDFEPRLCDFGQSRLSDEQNPALGTLFYMAPEQADLKAIPDARWDVYALGSLLYHMLCGQPPHKTPDSERRIREADTLEERLSVYRRVLNQSPRPVEHRRLPGVDRRLADIVDRCLHTDPSRRFANAQAVLDALDIRDRLRARRPLVALGFVGPGLLLMAMALTIGDTMLSAVSTARSHLTDRALESDVLPAKILARSLQRDLEDRRMELQKIADDPRLRQIVADASNSEWQDRSELQEFLDDLKQTSDETHKQLGRPPDQSWFLADAEGFQRWRHRFDPSTMNKNYSHRDYFHGRGLEYERGNAPDDVEPIRAPHISLAFRSDATKRFMVALTVPVWDADRQHVTAVLARTAHLGEILDDYRRSIDVESRDEIDREVALVECGDWKLIDHPWMQQENLRELPDEIYPKLALTGQVVERLQTLKSAQPAGSPRSGTVRIAGYRDPVGQLPRESAALYQGRWLAAFALIGNTDWVAIVQERQEAALEPVDEMQAGLIRTGLWAFGVVVSLIGLLWYFVWRAINDRSFRVWSARRSPGRSNDSLSTPSAR